MGLMKKAVRRATPRSVRKAKAVVRHPARTAVHAATPRSIRNAKRTAFNITHPINTAENAVLDSVTPRRRAKTTRPLAKSSGTYSAAEERAVLAQQLHEADTILLSSHLAVPSEARAPEAPAPEAVDRRAIHRRLQAESPDLPWWKLGQRRARRRLLKEETQRLVTAETAQRAAEQAGAQARLDRFWSLVCENDISALTEALQQAFADTAAVHVIGAFDGAAAFAVEMPDVEDVVNDQEAVLTPTGRLSVQARSKTIRNLVYGAGIAARLLHVMKIAFAAAPELKAANCAVIRPGVAGGMYPIYCGTFGRGEIRQYEDSTEPDRLVALLDAPTDALINLRGRTHEVSDIDIGSDRKLWAMKAWFDTSQREPDQDVAERLIRDDDQEVFGDAPSRVVPDVEFPQRVTKGWLEREVPDMKQEYFERLLVLLSARGWEPDEIRDRVIALRVGSR